MGRFSLGIGLLALFLILGLWVSFSMGSVHENIAQTLDEAAARSLAGDLDTARSLSQQAQTDWDNRWHGVASVADHAPMDEIDSLFAQLEVYGKAAQTADIAAYCARLATLVTAVGEAHALNWWNLL